MAAEASNAVVNFVKRPDPVLEESCMEVKDCDMPGALEDGQVLVKLTHISPDPYMKGRMSAGKSYTAGFDLGGPMNGGVVGEVVESKADGFAAGDVVTGFLPWMKFLAVPASALQKRVVPAGLSPGVFLGALGMPALSAYFSLKEIAAPKEGEIAWVSGAAGAVGMVAGQILKIRGCKVIGSAGTDEKVALLKEMGFDEAYNYKTTDQRDALKAFAPDGIDIYFDNVGGENIDIALESMRDHARMVLCGSISQYNLAPEDRYGVKNMHLATGKKVRMQGFIVTQFASQYASAFPDLGGWVASGQLKPHETAVAGFENLPKALCGLFTGANTGKCIVTV